MVDARRDVRLSRFSVTRSSSLLSQSMSQLQDLDNVPAPPRENEVVPSSPGAKAPRSPSVLAVDNESEPVVTRKELWSYYRKYFSPQPQIWKTLRD